MKSIKSLYFAAIIIAACITANAQTAAQDSTGLPGDNFSLAGALELFKQAGSPEEFEKLLNSENGQVNNLDLNGDGDIDYIKVIDKKEGDSHAFILQDVVSSNENQDVAVIELEKNGADNVSLQIVGDKDLYGEDVVVEPTPENAAQNNSSVAPAPAPVNVYAYPAVRYVYAPTYGIWVSPFRWGVRPIWYRPWRPVAYRVFYPYRLAYHHRYAVAYQPRPYVAHRVYAPVRTTSVTVQTRNAVTINRYRATPRTHAAPANTGTRTVIKKSTTRTGPRGNKTTRTRTRVKKN